MAGGPRASSMLYDDRRIAGLLVFVGSFQFTIGLMAAAAVDAAYSIHDNFISDLGVRAGAPIFNGSIIILGILIALGAYYIDRVLGVRWFTILLLVTAVGALGVGVFTEDFGSLHGLFSLVAFLGAGLTAIATFRFTTPPFSYICIVAGIISLVSLALFASGTYLGLGRGGMERMIVEPVLAWGLAFGGYLLAPAPGTKGTSTSREHRRQRSSTATR